MNERTFYPKLASYYDVHNVRTFSGGTEATAFDPRAVAALRLAISYEAPADPP